MKKRFLTLIMAGLMAMSLMVGCGSDETETAGNNVSNGVESNDDTATNNDTDSSAESDITKEDTQKIEYSKDDVIIEIAGVSFSMYDTWENIEPKLQNAGIKTTDNAGDPAIIIDGKDMMNIIVSLCDTTEEGTYIKYLTFCEYGGNEINREIMKVNGYNLNSTVDIGKEYELEDVSTETNTRYKGFITEEVRLTVDDNGAKVVQWDILRMDI